MAGSGESSHSENHRSAADGLTDSVAATATPAPVSATVVGFQYAPCAVGNASTGPHPPDVPLPATWPLWLAQASCVHLPPPDSGFSGVANASRSEEDTAGIQH